MATTWSGAETRLIFGQLPKAVGWIGGVPAAAAGAAASAAAMAAACGRKTINVYRFVHPSKAPHPISVTESGINMDVNDLHP